MKSRAIVAVAQTIAMGIHRLGLGAGSTWPGHIALHLQPHLIQEIVKKHPHLQIILVAGTNGKTTTAKMMRFILEKNGFTVFQNEEGANLLNGIASSLIKHNAVLSGKKTVAIFEVDENTLPPLLHEVTPSALVLLNLFRDQLDRYGEVNSIAEKWKDALSQLKQNSLTLVINGDDPQISFIGEQTSVKTKLLKFGLDSTLMNQHALAHDSDSIYCPRCGTVLEYRAIAYSHMGNFSCGSCGFKRDEVETFLNDQITYPLRGAYNRYNVHAALLTLREIFGLSLSQMKAALAAFTPAFGRQEEIVYKDRNVFLQLAKNPAGFNQSIHVTKELLQKGGAVLIVLNDRIPDGRDVSWIWDVDFEELRGLDRKIIVSGDRLYDMALRLKYAEIPASVVENLEEAIKTAVAATPSDGQLVVLPTYSALLEVRKILIGRALL